ncbi:MAG: dihydroxyacetone kinase subunit DhaK [Synergistaceae bacterium]|jgi:dihydroxyacetone kinase|nr:dihydroxyacetone kinase subunit DhaK [Synergistaceae bacterium]
MKKIMNVPDQFVDQSLRGILKAHSSLLKTSSEDGRALARADAPVKGKVAIVTGGGYGHLPLFLGYVGKGLCDGCAVGNVFTSPSCETVVNATKLVSGGKGVLYLIGNYMGDQMNFEMAADIVRAEEDIETILIRAADDVASAPREKWEERRGIAGILFAYKIAGAMAERGHSLQEVEKTTRKACERIATFGVAFSSCQLPEAAAPIFEIGDDDMELGMGIHGEKGVKRCKMMNAQELARYMVDRVTEDLCLTKGSRVAVLVNGLGSTSQEEQYILYGEVADILKAQEIDIAKAFVGEYVTSMEMSGVSVTLFHLDDELEELLKDCMYTPFIKL